MEDVKVVNLDDHRPHLMVCDKNNVAHVASVQLIRDYTQNKCELERDLLNAIVSDWLDSLLNGAE